MFIVSGKLSVTLSAILIKRNVNSPTSIILVDPILMYSGVFYKLHLSDGMDGWMDGRTDGLTD